MICAEPLLIRSSPSGFSVVSVRCPYCQRTHDHNVRGADVSRRAAPCGKGEYRICAAPPPIDGGEHVLYRFFNDEDELLYVGITNDPQNRFRSHRARANWWSKSSNITMTRFPNRRELMAAEIIAIRTEKPKYNLAYAGEEPPPPRPISKRSSNAQRLSPFPDASTFPAPDAIACDETEETKQSPVATRLLQMPCFDCGARRLRLEEDDLVKCDDCLNMWLYDEWIVLAGLRLPKLGTDG